MKFFGRVFRSVLTLCIVVFMSGCDMQSAKDRVNNFYDNLFKKPEKTIIIKESNQEDKAITHYNNGVRAIKEGNYHKAYDELSKAIREKATYKEAYLARAIAQKKSKDYREALVDLNKYNDFDKKNKQVYYIMGEINQILGENKVAISDYTKALLIDPDYESALVARAKLNMDHNNYLDAVMDYKRVLEKHPEKAELNYIIAVGLEQIGNYKEAERYLRKSIDSEKFVKNASLRLGMILGQGGRYEEALKFFEKALALDKENKVLVYMVGKTYLNLNKLDKALEYLTKAISLNGEFIEAYISRAIVYSKLGKSADAIRDSSMAIGLNGSYPNAYLIRAMTYSDSGQFREAISDYMAAIRLDPKLKQAYFYLGMTYFQMKDYRSAIGYFNQAIKVDSKFVEAYYNIALAMKFLDTYDNKAVLKELDKIFAMDPQNPDAMKLKKLIEDEESEASTKDEDEDKDNEIDDEDSEVVDEVSDITREAEPKE